MHEHILVGYPGWEVDQSVAPLDRASLVAKAVKLMGELRALGVNTVVDATTADFGRQADLYQEIAEKSEMQIICATGLYGENRGGSEYWKFRARFGEIGAEIYHLFLQELTVGIKQSAIKAGVIKLVSGKGAITDYENKVFQAAARAQQETGVPIITHTEMGTMGREQADLLIAAGVKPAKIQIGHMSNSTDLQYHLNVLASGVYSAFDRLGLEGLAGSPPDSAKLPLLIELIKRGFTERLILSHDYIMAFLGRPLSINPSDIPSLAKWHPSHLFKNVLPELKAAGVSDAQISTMLKQNPCRLFG
ncbi:MAG: phosphotriesterase-related protein [Desulfobacteraceae bacterium]|nr:MAG: phosphotriesterase-related protein [Desulfobacteraceae bacterium]